MNLGDIKKNRKISREAEDRVMKDLGFQLGRELEKARTKKGKTQNELARAIGSTQSVIAKIESGSKLPSFSFLQRLAEALGTHIIPPKFGFMEKPMTPLVKLLFIETNRPQGNLTEVSGFVKTDRKTLVKTNNYVA